VLYYENYRPGFFYLLVGIVVASGGWVVFNMSWFLEVSNLGLVRNLSIVGPMVVGAILSCRAWAVAVYAVRFDNETLTFGYLGWKVSLNRTEVISAKVVDIKWLKWGGVGWRVMGLKKIGYITRSGLGIEIETSLKGRSYTFNCSNPARLVDELQQAGSSTR
jgi:hypothetical protein